MGARMCQKRIFLDLKRVYAVIGTRKDLDHVDLSHTERDLFEGTCIHGTVEQDQKGTKNRDSSVCDIVKSTHMHEQRYEIRLFSLFSHSV